jgi:hypothetical protein
VVKYHGPARRHLLPLGFLMRPLLNGDTLGGHELRALSKAMQLIWHDAFDRLDPAVWKGLRVRVEGHPQPGFAVSASYPGYLRLATDDRARVWTRIDEDYWGYELLRAPGVEGLSIVPPITAELAREHREPNSAVSAAWARTYARMLRDAPGTPLCNGDWHLGALSREFSPFELAASIVRQVVNQKATGYVQWDFGDTVYPITLRDMSSQDAGRVKVWRKHVRDGSLPPVLLLWISGLAAYVVLDGHDRLMAASLEQAPAPALALEPVEEVVASEEKKRAVMAAVEKSLEAAKRERTRSHDERLARARRLFTTEDANRVLLDTFAPQQHAGRARAQPIPGGVEQWAAEVRQALALRCISDSNLLQAL